MGKVRSGVEQEQRERRPETEAKFEGENSG